jgi:hypothetical protein
MAPLVRHSRPGQRTGHYYCMPNELCRSQTVIRNWYRCNRSDNNALRRFRWSGELKIMDGTKFSILASQCRQMAEVPNLASSPGTHQLPFE